MRRYSCANRPVTCRPPWPRVGVAGRAAAWLGETDAGVLVASVRTWRADRAARARAVPTSVGTCSVAEPVDDLVALGLLPSPEGKPA